MMDLSTYTCQAARAAQLGRSKSEKGCPPYSGKRPHYTYAALVPLASFQVDSRLERNSFDILPGIGCGGRWLPSTMTRPVEAAGVRTTGTSGQADLTS